MNNNYIYGINKFGESIIFSPISNNSDLYSSEYICQVSLKESSNYNYTYDVSIVNKSNEQGMPIGKWKIKKGKINIMWGVSFSTFIMEDENGRETTSITACREGAGSKTRESVSIDFLTRAIFTKAKEIVEEYPNATVYNTLRCLDETKEKMNSAISLYKYNSKEKYSQEEFMQLIEKITSLFGDYVKMFKEINAFLKSEDNPKYKELSIKIAAECKKLMEELKNC